MHNLNFTANGVFKKAFYDGEELIGQAPNRFSFCIKTFVTFSKIIEQQAGVAPGFAQRGGFPDRGAL